MMIVVDFYSVVKFCSPMPKNTKFIQSSNSRICSVCFNLCCLKISPSPEDQDLEQENYRLLSRITALQQEKWVLEEKINHLEQGSAAMAEDLMCKTALIQYYFTEGRSGLFYQYHN